MESEGQELTTKLVLKALAITTFWFGLWTAIPASLLYPVARWVLIHTPASAETVGKVYYLAVAVLWLPTGFFVDFLYRRFVLKKRSQG